MIDYFKGKGSDGNWIIMEKEFSPQHLGKCESIMALGNGYLGVRATYEESYINQKRDTLVAGTFNQFDKTEPTELPNIADAIGIDFFLEGEYFSLETGTILFYERSLSLKNGQLTRKVVWKSPSGMDYELCFYRFVSLANRHQICQKVDITPLSENVNISIASGINGQVTNDGAQHFNEGKKRVFEKNVLEYIQTTSLSEVDVIIHSIHTFKHSHKVFQCEPIMGISRRKLSMEYHLFANKNETYTLEKVTTIHTSLDEEYQKNSKNLESYIDHAREMIMEEAHKGFQNLLLASQEKWLKYWEDVDIQISSKDSTSIDQIATRFAQYHLLIMTPVHDNSCGIGAKGLTGEGYKGHSFWDSEIFIMPYFLYTQPEIARGLLKYRYLTLDGARNKAKENGYDGAMYSWESARTGNEETPVWGAVNVETGEPTEILSGFLEQHITGDIAFAVDHYYRVTNDEKFMGKYGYEIVFETAKFWTSRLEWSDEKSYYELTNVVGPDEYKEEVDNNAFTNYMADWCINSAIRYINYIYKNDTDLYETLNKKLGLSSQFQKWMEIKGQIYLPKPNEAGIIPQDDTYLNKKIIDINKYKKSDTKQDILKQFSRKKVNEMQISKQADIVMLLYLFQDKFSKEIQDRNWDYYESKTIHDSSLSMAVHGIVSSYIGNVEKAYDCFKEAISIDVGQNKKSSDSGIHAASLGGVWKSIVFGFAGIKVNTTGLEINPNLPKQWDKVTIPIHWRGSKINISIDHNSITVEKNQFCEKILSLVINNKEIELKDTIFMKY